MRAFISKDEYRLISDVVRQSPVSAFLPSLMYNDTATEGFRLFCSGTSLSWNNLSLPQAASFLSDVAILQLECTPEELVAFNKIGKRIISMDDI